jgi:hypothetical protein
MQVAMPDDRPGTLARRPKAAREGQSSILPITARQARPALPHRQVSAKAPAQGVDEIFCKADIAVLGRRPARGDGNTLAAGCGPS